MHFGFASLCGAIFTLSPVQLHTSPLISWFFFSSDPTRFALALLTIIIKHT